MVDGTTRRRELANFLTRRRRAVPPHEVGLPSGSRRRTAGLRREEVAVLAGVSPTWYVYLEQARDIRPSVEVLDSLARVLRMSREERRYLHLLALERAPAPEDYAGPDRNVVAELERVVATAGLRNVPVYAVDWLYDVLAWNGSTVAWYTDWAAIPSERRNLLWWMVNDPLARDRVVDWERETSDLVARFRAIAAWRRGRSRFHNLLRELRGSPEFEGWWESQDVRGQQTRLRQLVHPQLGLRAFYETVLHPSGSDDFMVVLHLPADGDDGVSPSSEGFTPPG